MKKSILISIVFFFWFGLTFSYAGDFRTGKSIRISEKDTINTDLYIAAQYSGIYGKVKGDIWVATQSLNIRSIYIANLFAAANTIDVDSKIDGGALMLASNIRFKGEVKNGLKCAGGIINIEGNIGTDLIVAGGQVFIDKNVIINGDLIITGGEVVMDGTVKGNFIGNASKVYLSGAVEKNVDLSIEEELILNQGCKIGGNLSYKANKEFNLNKEWVKGSISFEKRLHKEWDIDRFITLFKIYSFFAALIIALVFLPFTRNKLKTLFEKLDTSNWVTLGIGFLGFIVIPVVIIILLALVLTIPLAIIIGALYCIILFIGKIFAGVYLGEKLLILINRKQPNIYLSSVVGLAVLYLLYLIPYIGVIIYAVSLFYGLGIGLKFFAQLFSKQSVRRGESTT